MKRVPLEFDTMYHFFNRGNNREKLFREHENYLHFLRLMKKYLLPVTDMYSYCLLPNHFHLILRIKGENEQPVEIADGSKKLSQAFSNCFNAYAKAINKRYYRTGSLFQAYPKRIKIEDERYLKNLILYVNSNSSHHEIEGYAAYPYSSYSALISTGKTNLKRSEVLALFEDVENFKYCLEKKINSINSIDDLSFED